MATLYHAKGEAVFKIVYCGPPGGGKTSNLRYIHRRLDPQWRGDMLSVATEQERTLCFDFLPMAAMLVSGLRTRFQLYTVPGQEIVKEARRAVLEGVDAVVFVADSSPDRMAANLASHRDLYRCLEENGIAPGEIPICYQYNKRDLPDAIGPEDLDDAFGVDSASYLACALSGYQIFATLDAATKQALRAFHRDRATALPEPCVPQGERRLAVAGA